MAASGVSFITTTGSVQVQNYDGKINCNITLLVFLLWCIYSLSLVGNQSDMEQGLRHMGYM